MCEVISIPRFELPDELIERRRLKSCIHTRPPGDQEELWFYQRQHRSLLPVWHHGALTLYPWGSSTRRDQLPQGGMCRQEQLEDGMWAAFRPELVDILATFAREGGFWYDVPKGIRGVVVQGPSGTPHVYVVTKPSTHYFRTMTRSDVEPVFLGPQI